MLGVPAEAEAVAVRRLDALARVQALVDEPVICLEQQLLHEERVTEVCVPAAHVDQGFVSVVGVLGAVVVTVTVRSTVVVVVVVGTLTVTSLLSPVVTVLAWVTVLTSSSPAPAISTPAPAPSASATTAASTIVKVLWPRGG